MQDSCATQRSCGNQAPLLTKDHLTAAQDETEAMGRMLSVATGSCMDSLSHDKQSFIAERQNMYITRSCLSLESGLCGQMTQLGKSACGC